MWINTWHFQHTAHASIGLFLRANLKVFFSPSSQLRTVFHCFQWKTGQLPPHFSNGKHLRKSVPSDQFLKNSFWSWQLVSRVLCSLYFFLLDKQTKTVSFKMATLKTYRRAAWLPVHPAALSSKRAEAAQMPPPGSQQLLCTHRSPPRRAQTRALDGRQKQNSLSSVQTQKVQK